MNLRRLGLLSTASSPMGDEALRNLLRDCRQNNGRRKICGYLHYHQGDFVQVLEGPDQVIGDCLERIRRDTRHHSIKVLFDEPVNRRTFANWSMGYSHDTRTKPELYRRIQAGIARLRSGEHMAATQVLMFLDQLMQAGQIEQVF